MTTTVQSFLLLLFFCSLSLLAKDNKMINRELEIELNTDLAIEYEGFEPEYYDCPAGYKSVGHGRNVEVFPLEDDEPYPMTVEYSKNWTADRIKEVRRDLFIFMPWLVEAPMELRVVFVDMTFNMGLKTFKKFKNMIQAAREGDYEKTAEELKDSLYFKQTGRRAKNHYNTILKLSGGK